MNDKPQDTKNQLITVAEWDARLPIGDWVGPHPTRLFMPRCDARGDLYEDIKAFRENHISSIVPKTALAELKAWVQDHVPQKYAWLVHGLDVHIPHQGIKFFALNSADVAGDEDFISRHPDVVGDSWDTELDQVRIKFIAQLRALACPVSFMTQRDAIDGGIIVKRGYERPRALQSTDLIVGQTEKRLWRYFSLAKFVQRGRSHSSSRAGTSARKTR